MPLAVSPSTPPRKPPIGPSHTAPRCIISVVAVAVVLAAVIGGWYYLSAQDEKASLELSQAVRTMDTPLAPRRGPAQPDVPSFTSAKERAQAAQKQFQAIVDKYPHTRTADMAHYFLGVTAAELV